MGKIILNNVDYSAPVTSGVSGVKGNAENNYRTGNVNLTPENIGALSLNGGTMNDNARIFINGLDGGIYIQSENNSLRIDYETLEEYRTVDQHTYNSSIEPTSIFLNSQLFNGEDIRSIQISNDYINDSFLGIEVREEIDKNTNSPTLYTSGMYFENGDIEILTDYRIDITFKEKNSSSGYHIYDTQITSARNGYTDLGGTNTKWKNIYATNGTIQTSDRTKKTNINSLETQKVQAFINGLNPVSYKMIDGTSGRTHYGFIAQDIEELMNTLNMNSKDFAGFIKSPKKVVKYKDEHGKKLKQPIEEIIEGEYDYSLRYDEFIAPLIKVVQEQQKAIENQQQQITQLKNALENANL